MADVTVAQFAEVLKVPVDRLLQQLDQAGIKVDGAEDMISEDAKHELLTHLRRSHGHDDLQADAAPRKITLRRKSQSELKLASPQGRARTVNVEVRSKRTYVKREVLEDQARHQQEEIDGSAKPRSRPRPRSSARNASALEKERLDRERLEEESRRRTRRGNAQAHRRGRGAPRRPKLLAREQAERERKAAPPPSPARRRARSVDDKATRYGRQELHIVGDVSSRHKKKKSRDGRRRSVGGESDTKHGFEMPTARVVREVADRRGHDGRRAGAKDGGQGHRSHQGHDEHGRDGDDQSDDRAGHRGAGGRGNGPHGGAAQGKHHRGRSCRARPTPRSRCCRVRRW